MSLSSSAVSSRRAGIALLEVVAGLTLLSAMLVVGVLASRDAAAASDAAASRTVAAEAAAQVDAVILQAAAADPRKGDVVTLTEDRRTLTYRAPRVPSAILCAQPSDSQVRVGLSAAEVPGATALLDATVNDAVRPGVAWNVRLTPTAMGPCNGADTSRLATISPSGGATGTPVLSAGTPVRFTEARTLAFVSSGTGLWRLQESVAETSGASTREVATLQGGSPTFRYLRADGSVIDPPGNPNQPLTSAMLTSATSLSASMSFAATRARNQVGLQTVTLSHALAAGSTAAEVVGQVDRSTMAPAAVCADPTAVSSVGPCVIATLPAFTAAPGEALSLAYTFSAQDPGDTVHAGGVQWSVSGASVGTSATQPYTVPATATGGTVLPVELRLLLASGMEVVRASTITVAASPAFPAHVGMCVGLWSWNAWNTSSTKSRITCLGYDWSAAQSRYLVNPQVQARFDVGGAANVTILRVVGGQLPDGTAIPCTGTCSTLNHPSHAPWMNFLTSRITVVNGMSSVQAQPTTPALRAAILDGYCGGDAQCIQDNAGWIANAGDPFVVLYLSP